MGEWEGLSPPYGTIVVDPPWHYDGLPVGPEGGVRTCPLPYSSMSLDEIKALPIGDLARDTRLFLWTTNRYLPDSFDVLAAWGFTYRQTLVWHKVDVNLPASVAPNSAEFVLVGTSGSPLRGQCLPSSVIRSSRPRKGGHSEKPEHVMDLIEQVSPGPYVELFCRRPRFGWDHWGHGYEIGTAA